MGSLWNSFVMPLHEKGSVSVQLQYDHNSSQRQNFWSQKRPKINAFPCYQWLWLWCGRVATCSIPCYYKRGILVGMWGPLYCLEMTFQTGLDSNGMSLGWARLPLNKGNLPSTSNSLVNGEDINWFLVLSTQLVVIIWDAEQEGFRNQQNNRSD